MSSAYVTVTLPGNWSVAEILTAGSIAATDLCIIKHVDLVCGLWFVNTHGRWIHSTESGDH